MTISSCDVAERVQEKLRNEAGIVINEDWQDPWIVYAALQLVTFQLLPRSLDSALYQLLAEGPTEDDDAYYDAREATGQ